MVQNTATEAKPFTPINNLSKWVSWIFLILIVLNLIAILSRYAQAELLKRAIAGGIITESEATANDMREAVIGFVQFGLYVTSGILFLIWIHRAYKNLHSIRADGLRFTPGWAVGWFFVPIMSLFRPYQVVSEIWRASNPKIDLADTTSWQTSVSSSVVGWWWAFFLISNFVANIALRTVFSGEELSDLLTSTYAYIVSDAIDVVGILITILMVRRIGQFQETKHTLIKMSLGD